MDYAKHVAKIAKANGVKLVFVESIDDCYGYIDSRTAHILAVTDEITYAIAMHELGHILGPMQGYHDREATPFNPRRETFSDGEIGAWLWAKANTEYWLVGMQGVMQACLDSYQNNMPDGRLKLPKACPSYKLLF